VFHRNIAATLKAAIMAMTITMPKNLNLKKCLPIFTSYTLVDEWGRKIFYRFRSKRNLGSRLSSYPLEIPSSVKSLP
jgi:hypothetical protein